MSRWDYYGGGYFPPSIPRKAKGGIRAQSKRGSFGESWWAKRWIAVLESFQIGARLNRGRSYARSGQVLSIEIEKGMVRAKVQGSRPSPYAVTIKVKPLTAGEWKKLAGMLSQQAIFAAQLLAGQMPQEIEQAFQKAGLSLFPNKQKDLETDCSCPDWSNPCKHIAAVYYLLGEEFERDPFLIFKMRGLTQEELVAALGESHGQATKKTGKGGVSDSEPSKENSSQPEPLAPADPHFWTPGKLPEEVWSEAQLHQAGAALLKRLGNFPFWRGKVGPVDALEPTYTAAAPRGTRLLLGERELE
ncbi:MAG: SWIM zinc finger family protein [Terriglobia bacterium]|jgi:uncharacterized Zn finger protein